ncbi:hypothetical protein MBLNU230_g8376t1 [Neophaeotheca triangularis]
MAEGQTIVTDATDGAPALGSLFDGKRFFLVQRVPSRQHFISQIQANGGRVVKLEAQADYIVADHKRRDAPAGSISWAFIDRSIKDGELKDPADHPAGPPVGAARAVGSGVPSKATRTPFTPEDDEFLWEWVQAAHRRGGMVKGNQIYQELERKNSRHTFQAWRDRYLKKMHGIRALDIDAPSTPAVPAPNSAPAPVSAPANPPEFTQDDFDQLLLQAHDILNVAEENLELAWDAWHDVRPTHTAEEWAAYFDEVVKPEYLRKKGLRNGDRGDARDEDQEESEDEQPEATPSKAGKRKRDALGDSHAQPAGGRKATKHTKVTSNQTAASTSAYRNGENHSRQPQRVPSTTFDPDSSDSKGFALSAAPRPQNSGRQSAEAVQTLESDEGDMDGAMPTSEANAAIEAQIQADVDAQQSAVRAGNGHERQQPKVAEAREYLEDKDEEGEQVDEALIEGAGAAHGSGLGQALTEENLASQQAQHRVHLLRGKDLPEDDDKQDQTGYLEYLQETMQEAKRNDRDGPTPRKAGQDGQPLQGSQAAESEHMFSSQANNELGGVDLRWPSMSPQGQRAQPQQPESQNFSFETQVNNSSLPAQYPDLSNKNGKQRPEEVAAALLKSTSRPEQNTSRTHNHWISQQQKSQREGGVDASTADDDFAGLDLSMPEPDGGFDFSFGDEQNGMGQEPLMMPSQTAQPQELARKAQDDEEMNARNSTEIVVSSNSASGDGSQTQNQPSQQPPAPQTLDTQAILNAETQQPDLSMPLPPDSDSGSEPLQSQHYEKLKSPAPSHSSPHTRTNNQPKPLPPYALAAEAALRESRRRSSKPLPQPSDNEPLNDDDIMSYIASIVRRGYDEAKVLNALQATSMRPELAEEVLWLERRGEGFPDRMPGAWSEAEDRAVEGGDAGAMRELEVKHGWDEVRARLQFLQDWREG